MLDANLLRGEIDSTAERLKTRGFELDVARLNELESRRKDLQVRTQELQNERNTRSKSIGQAKGRGEDIAPLLAEVGQLGEKLDAAKAELNDLLEEIKDYALTLPNLPHPSAPIGKDEDENVELHTWGELPSFDFEAKAGYSITVTVSDNPLNDVFGGTLTLNNNDVGTFVSNNDSGELKLTGHLAFELTGTVDFFDDDAGKLTLQGSTADSIRLSNSTTETAVLVNFTRSSTSSWSISATFPYASRKSKSIASSTPASNVVIFVAAVHAPSWSSAAGGAPAPPS